VNVCACLAPAALGQRLHSDKIPTPAMAFGVVGMTGIRDLTGRLLEWLPDDDVLAVLRGAPFNLQAVVIEFGGSPRQFAAVTAVLAASRHTQLRSASLRCVPVGMTTQQTSAFVAAMPLGCLRYCFVMYDNEDHGAAHDGPGASLHGALAKAFLRLALAARGDAAFGGLMSSFAGMQRPWRFVPGLLAIEALPRLAALARDLLLPRRRARALATVVALQSVDFDIETAVAALQDPWLCSTQLDAPDVPLGMIPALAALLFTADVVAQRHGAAVIERLRQTDGVHACVHDAGVLPRLAALWSAGRDTALQKSAQRLMFNMVTRPSLARWDIAGACSPDAVAMVCHALMTGDAQVSAIGVVNGVALAPTSAGRSHVGHFLPTLVAATNGDGHYAPQTVSSLCLICSRCAAEQPYEFLRAAFIAIATSTGRSTPLDDVRTARQRVLRSCEALAAVIAHHGSTDARDVFVDCGALNVAVRDVVTKPDNVKLLVQMAGGDARHQRAVVEAGALRGLHQLIEFAGLHRLNGEGGAYWFEALLVVACLIDGRDAEVLQRLCDAGLLRLLERSAVFDLTDHFSAMFDVAENSGAHGAVLRLAATGPAALARCAADSWLPQLLCFVFERDSPLIGDALAAIDRVLRLEDARSAPVHTAPSPPPRKRGRSDAAPTLVPTSGGNVFVDALVWNGVTSRIAELRDGGGRYASAAHDTVSMLFPELPPQ
jgi:hypothetical protein